MTLTGRDASCARMPRHMPSKVARAKIERRVGRNAATAKAGVRHKCINTTA